jgi:NADPH:quinone reductase-like Zn-dependent oxidoreductase
MQAMVLTGINQPLQLQKVPDAVAGPGEAVVALHAAALNHRDVWIQKGQYAGLQFPVIPGSDGAGVVASVGADVDPAWVGQEVVICPSLNWGPDVRAQGTTFQILGLPRAGTLAESVTVPALNLYAKPQDLSFEQAASLGLAGLTAYRALFTRAQVRAGERVLVTGIGGGVAQFALQFAVAAGAEVWVTSGSADKIKLAQSLGAKGGANYKSPTWITDLKALVAGFEVIIDGAGGDGFGDLLDAAVPGGRIVSYGATRGAVRDVPMRKIFWKQLNILGSTMGTPQEFGDMLQLVNQSHIKPKISAVFPLASAQEAFTQMDQGQQNGKLVVKIR